MILLGVHFPSLSRREVSVGMGVGSGEFYQRPGMSSRLSWEEALASHTCVDGTNNAKNLLSWDVNN